MGTQTQLSIILLLCRVTNAVVENAYFKRLGPVKPQLMNMTPFHCALQCLTLSKCNMFSVKCPGSTCKLYSEDGARSEIECKSFYRKVKVMKGLCQGYVPPHQRYVRREHAKSCKRNHQLLPVIREYCDPNVGVRKIEGRCYQVRWVRPKMRVPDTSEENTRSFGVNAPCSLKYMKKITIIGRLSDRGTYVLINLSKRQTGNIPNDIIMFSYFSSNKSLIKCQLMTRSSVRDVKSFQLQKGIFLPGRNFLLEIRHVNDSIQFQLRGSWPCLCDVQKPNFAGDVDKILVTGEVKVEELTLHI